MELFNIPWTMHGVATVEADDYEDAKELVQDGIEWWSGDIDWVTTSVDGYAVG